MGFSGSAQRVIGICLAAMMASAVHADEVIVGFGNRLPPFVLPESKSGVTVEIFREALAYRGHAMKPDFLPLKRVPQMFAARLIDVAMLDFGIDVAKVDGVYGEPAFVYDNVLVTLADRHIKIERPNDLQGLSVLGFQGALGVYPEWVTEADRAGKYQETNNQMLQVLTLLSGENDVVLSDRNIFEYFRNQADKKYGAMASKFEIHQVVSKKPIYFRTVFRDKNLRDDYNAGISYLKKSGKYDEIIKKYGAF
jgi:polar amino acid transport system substrate-binding protein